MADIEFTMILGLSLFALFLLALIVFHRIVGRAISKYIYWWHSNYPFGQASKNILEGYKNNNSEKIEKIFGWTVLVVSLFFLLITIYGFYIGLAG